VSDTIRRTAKQVDPHWKKRVADVLQSTGLVEHAFTGAVEIRLTKGGVCLLTKREDYQ
jgi:hypothetical protein